MLDISAVLDIRIYPQYPRKVILSWETVKKDLPYPIAANIFRSGTKEGEYKKINPQPVIGSFFEDIGLKPLSKLFDVTYKIAVGLRSRAFLLCMRASSRRLRLSSAPPMLE